MIAAVKPEQHLGTTPEGQVAPPEFVPWEIFEKEYLHREDNYKYEWVRGHVVQTPYDMNQYQYYILINLQKCFQQLLAAAQVSGHLLAEIDTFFLKNVHRRPDLAWFTEEQAARMAHRENQVPNFVIEIVSDHDIVDNLLNRLGDYRTAEVAVVWLISPKLEQVHIFSGDKSAICRGGDVCSAEPALPGFEIRTEEIFKKPELPA